MPSVNSKPVAAPAQALNSSLASSTTLPEKGTTALSAGTDNVDTKAAAVVP
jgi:hypothetical protein